MIDAPPTGTRCANSGLVAAGDVYDGTRADRKASPRVERSPAHDVRYRRVVR